MVDAVVLAKKFLEKKHLKFNEAEYLVVIEEMKDRLQKQE
ncbi:MAG: hypothetical protein JWR26_1204 [Pedosphaera sp.]|nr:hypothetical protein [Pedosphaera sp.]